MGRIKIISDPPENDMRNIFFPFDSIDADVFSLLDSLLESGRVRIVSDVHGRHPVSDLPEKSD